jgi:hypothetical protein
MFIPSFIKTDQLFKKTETGHTHAHTTHLHTQPSCLKTLLLFLILGMKVGYKSSVIKSSKFHKNIKLPHYFIEFISENLTV